MDKDLRNRLRGAIVECRKRLEEDVRRQLEGTYGVLPDGQILPEDALGGVITRERRVARAKIADALRHIESHGLSRARAMEQFVRENAFTSLNRLASLKLLEHPSRALIQESVGKGRESRGVQLFQRISPEACRAEVEGGYRLYLDLLFADLAQELRVLFDQAPASAIVAPGDNCLREILEILNDPALDAAWAEDETIGWIYQYFTPKELRDESRKKGAPRDSYELAFRNQFYTPRYVVRFLVDNTLGRLWYEMRRGATRLREQCRYLVTTPGEMFAEPGLSAAASRPAPGGPEDPLAQPIPIRARDRKDPRDIRLLDPACGSGHFLLYAYDVLVTMYEEAWEDPESPPCAATRRTLRQDYPELHALRAAMPTLILERNLHGIDIDLRAVQIAALTLWLRAQRSYAEFGVKPADRLPITRTNVVCAEPMPGEADLLEEFLRDLRPRLLAQVVRKVFDSMELAGEAGSLLRIEVEIRDTLAEAKRQWRASPPPEQLAIWPDEARRKAEQQSLFDLAGIDDEEFWRDAEAQVLRTLRQYAESVDNGRAYSRRLFVNDASQGFAFVDVCRKRFDVVLMNPPFGAASQPSKPYVDAAYPRTKNDLYAAFVERGLEWLRPRSFLGAITSRTGFFLSSFQAWREEILLKEARVTVMADLGQGVLDTAMVETAAYCLEKAAGEATCPD